MQGAVEYSQLPRCASTPAAAADACSKPMSAAASSSRSYTASAKQHANAQQQRVGPPAEGSFLDAMQFEGGSASAVGKTSLPLSDMVNSGDDDGNNDGGGGDVADVVAVTRPTTTCIRFRGLRSMNRRWEVVNSRAWRSWPPGSDSPPLL
jgi:hypothetical protein